MESLPEGSPARGEANLLLAQLAQLQEELERAAEADASPEQYDIADGASEWSESHDLGPSGLGTAHSASQANPPPPTAAWQASGHGRWQKGKGQRDLDKPGGGKGSAGGIAAAATATPPAPAPAATTPLVAPQSATAAAAAAPVAPAAAAAAAAAAEGAPRPLAAAAANAGAAAATNRIPSGGDGPTGETEEGEPASRQKPPRAAGYRLGRRLFCGPADQERAGTVPTPGGRRRGWLQHSQRSAPGCTTACATCRTGGRADHGGGGVQPITDEGLDLIMLGPDDLRGWAQSHLDGGSYW